LESSGTETSEPTCRGPLDLWRRGSLGGGIEGSSGSRVHRAPKGSWCGGLHGSSRFCGLFGVRGPEGLERAALTWLTEQVREGSKARAGQRSRRRDGWTPDCQRAGGGPSESATAFAWSKTRVGERQERLSSGNRGQRSGGYLEEQQTRRGERSWARSNRRPCDSRLCAEKSLEVEVLGSWQPIRR
jgi:hypothetical protein